MRYRFDAAGKQRVTRIVAFVLLGRVATGHRWMHVEKWQEFDGEPGYSRAQGED